MLKRVALTLIGGILLTFAFGCEPGVDDPFSGNADYEELRESGDLIEGEGGGSGGDTEDSGDSADDQSSSLPGRLTNRLFASSDSSDLGALVNQDSGSELQQEEDSGDGEEDDDGEDDGVDDGGDSEANGGAAENGETDGGEAQEEQSEAEQAISERFSKYRNVNFQSIIERKYEGLDEAVTNVENDIPYQDVGRSDPLSFPDPRIPEELRPPRQGETDVSQIQEFFQTFSATQRIRSTQIDVIGVLSVGFRRQVSVEINGQQQRMSEGQTTYSNGVRITARKVSQAEVVFTLEVPQANISKQRAYIPE